MYSYDYSSLQRFICTTTRHFAHSNRVFSYSLLQNIAFYHHAHIYCMVAEYVLWDSLFLHCIQSDTD